MRLSGRYLFTSESVSDGHPDKVCDAISDGVLDLFLESDSDARVAVETMVTKSRVMIVGEVASKQEIDAGSVEMKAREVVRDIGYEDKDFHWQDMDVEVQLQRQSADIALGVDKDGAGDQGIMFGFACDETEMLMPAPIHYSHRVMESLRDFRRSPEGKGLGADAKVQLTLHYEDGCPYGIHTAVLSSLHDKTLSEHQVGELLYGVLSRSVPSGWLHDDTVLLFNPTGRFEVGGPACDAGLTGRKIVVDTYGGAAPHGGGAFSGKDPSKVDRSAAYAARYVAKNVVAAGLASHCLIQLAYSIGKAEPLAFYVDCFGSEKVESEILLVAIKDVIDWRVRGIRDSLSLDRPIYRKTSSFGHFGRESLSDGSFSWERTDLVERLRDMCGTMRKAAIGC